MIAPVHSLRPEVAAGPEVTATTTRLRRSPRARWLRTFALVLLVLGPARLALPGFVRRHVERVLDGAEGYAATVGGLDLNLWRGAYVLEDVEIRREGGDFERPFLSAERTDLSVRWASLLRGRVVAEIVMHHPTIEYVTSGSGSQAQTGGEVGEDGERRGWTGRIGELFPFRIDRFVVRDGELRFTHLGVDPPVDVFMTDAFLEVLNLTNERLPDAEQGYLAEAEAAGRPFGTGEFEARLRFDPLAEQPRFELDGVLREIELIELNDFLQAYGNVDAEDGTLEVFAEFAASNGKIEGYVKTLIERLDLVDLDEIDDPIDFLQTLWEGFVALGAELLENQSRDRIAVRIPLRGELGATRTDLAAIVGSLLRNAFIAALRPAIDASIELEDLEIVVPEKRAEERER